MSLCAPRDPSLGAKASADTIIIKELANQSEFRYPSLRVTTDLETPLGVKFASTPWSNDVPSIYTEMTSAGKGRPQDTCSPVDLFDQARAQLVRTYFGQDVLHADGTAVLGGFVLPLCSLTSIRAVKLENWGSARDEIVWVVED